jgi:hypothetical protein
VPIRSIATLPRAPPPPPPPPQKKKSKIKYLISTRDLIPRVGEQDHITPQFGLLDESSANVVDQYGGKRECVYGLRITTIVKILGVFFLLFAGAVYRVFVGSVLGCLSRCFLLGCRLGSLCILRGALRFSCLLRGALRFLIYATLLIKKKQL